MDSMRVNGIYLQWKIPAKRDVPANIGWYLRVDSVCRTWESPRHLIVHVLLNVNLPSQQILFVPSKLKS